MEQLHGTPLRTTAQNTGQRRRSNTDFLGIAILKKIKVQRGGEGERQRQRERERENDKEQ